MSLPSTPSGSTKWSPPLRTLEEVVCLLKPHQGPRLKELSLCWHDSPKLQVGETHSSSSNSRKILHKKNLAALNDALQKTPSRITKISIGHKHGDNRKGVLRLLQVLVAQAKSPAFKQTLESLELVLLTSVPDQLLVDLLLAYAPQLRSLHIQATPLQKKTPLPPAKAVFKNAYQTVHAVDYLYSLQQESCLTLLAHPQLAPQLVNLTSLKFIDDNVTDREVDILVTFLWRKFPQTGIQTLSLRSNRHMTPSALAKICQAPVSVCLDLSLCDVKHAGALAMAHALTQGSWRQRQHVILQELIMAGNYQLEQESFVALCRACPYQVKHWNLSYCDMTEHKSLVVLRELLPVLTRSADCPLQQLTLQGCQINHPQACALLVTILQHNRSLTALRLNDPKNPRYLDPAMLQTLVQQGLKHHYGIKELALDVRRQSSNNDEMDFYLSLNRAGRHILQDQNQLMHSKQAWILTLAKARHSGRFDVLYWLLRNGVIHLFP
jgi:hypothetical protein